MKHSIAVNASTQKDIDFIVNNLLFVGKRIPIDSYKLKNLAQKFLASFNFSNGVLHYRTSVRNSKEYSLVVHKIEVTNGLIPAIVFKGEYDITLSFMPTRLGVKKFILLKAYIGQLINNPSLVV